MTQPNDSTQVATPQTNPEVVAPDGQAAIEPAPEPEVQYIQLRRDQLYREFARLEEEDPEVKRVLSQYVGNKAARQYQPQIRQHEQELAELRKERFQLEVKSMTAEDIEAKAATDRDWGKKYIDFVHDQKGGQVRQQVDETPLVEEALSNLVDFARRNGLPESDWDKVLTKANNGAYGNNTEHWTVQLPRMQQDVMDMLLQVKKPVPVQTTNPALTRGGPDLSASGGSISAGSAAGFPKSAAEFRELPAEEQRRWLASDRDKVIALSQK